MTIRWPWWVRWSHWVVAVMIFASWMLAYGWQETGWIHRSLGYAVCGVLLLRWIGGCLSVAAAARFYWPGWALIHQDWVLLKKRQWLAQAGHHPIGQWAVYALWSTLLGLCVTGVLCRTDALWGEDWPINGHAWFSHALMALVALHVCAVLGLSVWLKQPLLRAMLVAQGQSTTSKSADAA